MREGVCTLSRAHSLTHPSTHAHTYAHLYARTHTYTRAHPYTHVDERARRVSRGYGDGKWLGVALQEQGKATGSNQLAVAPRARDIKFVD